MDFIHCTTDKNLQRIWDPYKEMGMRKREQKSKEKQKDINMSPFHTYIFK